MKAHPAAALFPLMTVAEYQGLVEDIRKHGLRHPIVTLDGQILDGRNRERACTDVGVKARYVEADLNGSSPVEYVMGENLHRRHLTPSQAAAIAAKAIPLFAAEAKERQREGQKRGGEVFAGREARGSKDPKASGKAVENAAEKFGVASAQVTRAVALKKRAPEIFTKVEAGELTIGSALKKAGLNRTGATAESARPRNKHNAVLLAATNLARASERWERAMTDDLTPPQARKQLTVLRKARELLDEVIEAVEYRADTLATFRR